MVMGFYVIQTLHIMSISQIVLIVKHIAQISEHQKVVEMSALLLKNEIVVIVLR